MALTSSGTISMSDIRTELGGSGTIGLQEASNGTVATINTNNASGNRPDGSAPHSMDEFYSYDHGASSATTQWSNVPADFTLDAPSTGTYTVAKQITLANGTGNTVVGLSVSGNAFLAAVAASRTGDPGASGTSNSGTGYSATSVTVAHTTGTLYLRFRLGYKAAFDGQSANGDVTFTNNSVANSALDITYTTGGGP